MVHLSTIGSGVSIDVGSTRLNATSPHACAALMYLIVERGKEMARRPLVEMLFPDSSDGAGGHALRQLVYRLRKLGAPLEGDAARVILARDAASWDIEAIESRGHCTEAELDALARGYLSTFAPSVSDTFSSWLENHRSTVSSMLRRVLLDQIRDEKAKHHFAVVDRVAKACLALDPLNEEATLATAEALAMTGSKSAAMAVLERYIEEVGGRSRELTLAPKLLRERISEYVVDTGLHVEPPLVGREGEIVMLRALLSRVWRGVPEACVVWGPSGIGKTRLLNEACGAAAIAGISVVRCALQPHDQYRPLAVLRDVGRSLLDLPGALGCTPESLSFVRGLCGRGVMPPRSLPRSTDDSELALAEAIGHATELLDAVSGEKPLLLCIEDGHWLDPASVDFIIEAVGKQRAVCILLASQRRLQLPKHLVDAVHFSMLEVPSLPEAQSRRLMEQLFERSGRPTDREFLEWGVGLADGVPFYLQSLFVEHATTGDRTTIPLTLQSSLASKLERLGEPERSLFDAIVVLGPLCTFARLETLIELPKYSLLVSLRELEERGLIRSSGTSVTCTHELFAVAARLKMPASVAKMLHRSFAELLENEGGDSGVEPWVIAAHWQESGEMSRGLRIVRQCAEQSIRIGRPQDAIEILSKARTTGLSSAERRELMEDQLAAFEAAGQGQAAAGLASELLPFLPENDATGRDDLELRRIRALALSGGAVSGYEPSLREIFCRTTDDTQRLNAGLLLLTIAENSGNPQLALETIGRIERSSAEGIGRLMPYMVYHAVFGELRLASEAAKEVFEVGRNARNPILRQRIAHNTARVLHWIGETDNAIERLTNSYRDASAAGLRGGEIADACYLSLIYWCRDDQDRFEDWLSKAEAAADRGAAPDLVINLYANTILRALEAGDLSEAELLLANVRSLYPQVSEGRRAHLLMACAARIGLAAGRLPTSGELSILLHAHSVGKALGNHDFVADAVCRSLFCVGRAEEGHELRDAYVSSWRRERYPVPSRCSTLMRSPHVV